MAPLSSLLATYSNVSPASANLGVMCLATNAAVACSHPMSAATRSSTGCGCSSAPPIFLGRSVRIVCPRTVAAVAPPAPDAVTSYRLTCAPSAFGPAASLDAHLKRDEPRASR